VTYNLFAAFLRGYSSGCIESAEQPSVMEVQVSTRAVVAYPEKHTLGQHKSLRYCLFSRNAMAFHLLQFNCSYHDKLCWFTYIVLRVWNHGPRNALFHHIKEGSFEMEPACLDISGI